MVNDSLPFEMSLENSMRLLGVKKGTSFENILTTKKIICWKIYDNHVK